MAQPIPSCLQGLRSFGSCKAMTAVQEKKGQTGWREMVEAKVFRFTFCSDYAREMAFGNIGNNILNRTKARNFSSGGRVQRILAEGFGTKILKFSRGRFSGNFSLRRGEFLRISPTAQGGGFHCCAREA